MRWWWWLWLLSLCRPALGEIFTSLVGLEKLLRSESHLADSLADYIRAEEERLGKLRQVLESRSGTRYIAELAASDASNPIVAFRFIKNSIHLTANALSIIEGEAKSRAMVAGRMEAKPEEADLDGAAVALFRIQDTYHISARALADARLPGTPPNVSVAMSADDAFHLGYSAAQTFDFYHATQWMLEAERRAKEEEAATQLSDVSARRDEFNRSFNDSLLFDYLAYSLYEQGNPEWAAYYARKLQAIDPTYPAVDNLQVYTEALANQSSTWDGSLEALPPLRNERDTQNAYLDYEALCRGEEKLSEAKRSRLFCFLRRDSAFAFLAPFKVEVLHRQPDLLLFHQVLSDQEVGHLKDLATPQLQRAMVVKEEGTDASSALGRTKLSGDSVDAPPDAEDSDGNIIASYRIAQNMWVEDEEDAVVAAVSARVRDMTNLGTDYAENLQIANYGIGGHYEPHYDMSTEEVPKGGFNEEHGNRIATVLFYFNAPEAGGFTVFEELGLALRPQPRSAAFWMNVQRDGSPDMLTRHAACPVLYGVKWVANKWLHEFGQETRRPCYLSAWERYDPLPPPPFQPSPPR